MVVVEAMASGLPVVASAIGGIPEILKFGGGVLVEPSNSTVLATELKRLILERNLRMRMREQAINVIQAHFTWDLIRQRYTQIADEVATCGDIHKTISSEILVSC